MEKFVEKSTWFIFDCSIADSKIAFRHMYATYEKHDIRFRQVIFWAYTLCYGCGFCFISACLWLYHMFLFISTIYFIISHIIHSYLIFIVLLLFYICLCRHKEIPLSNAGKVKIFYWLLYRYMVKFCHNWISTGAAIKQRIGKPGEMPARSRRCIGIVSAQNVTVSY